MQDVVATSSRVGIESGNAILGASQGIVQGAIETGTDINVVVTQTIKVVSESAKQIGLSEDEAIARAVEGVLQAAEALEPQVAAEVVEAIPEEILPSANG